MTCSHAFPFLLFWTLVLMMQSLSDHTLFPASFLRVGSPNTVNCIQLVFESSANSAIQIKRVCLRHSGRGGLLKKKKSDFVFLNAFNISHLNVLARSCADGAA